MRLLPVFLILFLTAVFNTSCDKDVITREISQLGFSTDTLIFDTVFTSIGTATRNFRIYNRGNGTLRISSIQLATQNSPFRINVDGVSGTKIENIDILPNDSAFVFVEATINPNGINTPLIVADSILFNINGQVKDLDVVAWGQDAIYIRPDTYSENLPPYRVLPQNSTWTNLKPYVIYGYAVVDEGATLTIEAGTRVHFHSGSGLWVYAGGNIKVKGTAASPVTFQGDRLEPFYKDLPGQWDRIVINQGSVNNEFEHAIIKNALIGIQAEYYHGADNTYRDPTLDNTLKLTNCVIQNHSGFGIYARNYRITAENVVVANAGQYCMGITGGGEFNFTHCTFANYFSAAIRSTPAFYMTDRYKANETVFEYPITNTRFTNCIFYGTEKTEFAFDTFHPSTSYVFEHCLLKSEEPINSSALQNVLYNLDPRFKDRSAYDWSISENSGARNQGKPTPVRLDITGKMRDETPDLGAFEYVP